MAMTGRDGQLPVPGAEGIEEVKGLVILAECDYSLEIRFDLTFNIVSPRFLKREVSVNTKETLYLKSEG